MKQENKPKVQYEVNYPIKIVIEDKISKETTDYAALQARALVNAEVNQNKLFIDRTVFVKSLEEKKKANTAKGNYKLLQKNKEKFHQTQTALWDEILSYKPHFNINYVVSKNK